MRKALLFLGAGLVSLGLTGSASAAPYTASLTIEFATMTPMVANASGNLAVTGEQAVTSGFTLTGSVFTFSTFATISPAELVATSPVNVFLHTFAASGTNATGNFGAGGVGTMPINGQAQLFLTALGFINITQTIPFNGLFGVTSSTTIPSSGLVPPIQLIGAGFVPSTVSANTTSTGGSVVTVTRQGSISTSTTTGGDVVRTLNLVSPLQVVIDPGTAGESFTAVFATLALQITDAAAVPEPGTLLLVALGVTGLVVVGRRRGDL